MNLEHYQGPAINITTTPDQYPTYFGQNSAQIPYSHPIKLLFLQLGLQTTHRLLQFSLAFLQKANPSLIHHLETEICLPPDELVANIGYFAQELKNLRIYNQNFRRGKLPGHLIEVK